MISNDNVLEREHLALGIKYVSKQTNGEFNDSEALIYDIARYLEGETKELTAEGSIAFIIIKRNADGKPTTLFFGRNSGNPLIIKKTDHSLTISSQGAGVEAKVNTLYSYDYETGDMTERYMYIPYYKMKSTSGSEDFSSYSRTQSNSLTYRGYSRGYSSDDDYWADQYEEEHEMDRLGGPVDDSPYATYGTVYTPESRKIINDTNWKPIFGSHNEMRSRLLTDAVGDYETAAIAALVEASEAEQEEKRINDGMYGVLNDSTYEGLSEYWYYVNTYKNYMTELSKDFEQTAVVHAARRDQRIQLPSGIDITNKQTSLTV